MKNQKGRVFGPALLTENNVKIFTVTQGSAADITLDTHTETPHFALSTINSIPHPRHCESHQYW